MAAGKKDGGWMGDRQTFSVPSAIELTHGCTDLKGWSLAASSKSSPMLARIALRLALASSLDRCGLKVFSYCSPPVSFSFFCSIKRSEKVLRKKSAVLLW